MHSYWTFRLGVVATAAAIALVIPSSLPAQVPTAPPKKYVHKPKDPEAAALMIHLLQRYVSNVPKKTALDKKLETLLADNPESRNIAKRMISNIQQADPNDRRRVMGGYSEFTAKNTIEIEKYQETFKRLQNLRPATPEVEDRDEPPTRSKLLKKHERSESPNDEEETGKPAPEERRPFKNWLKRSPWPRGGIRDGYLLNAQNGGDNRYQLYYNGMWARYETDEDHLTDSDEIYIIMTVAQADGTTSSPIKFPQRHDPPYYWDVDTGEHRPKSGNITRIWGGPNGRRAQDLTVAVWVWEQDSGDPDERRQATELAWTTASAICAATVAETTPVPCIISILGAGLIEGIVDIASGGDDDLVGDVAQIVEITDNQIRNWVSGGLRDLNIPAHFRTIHRGSGHTEGADYRVYFAFHNPLDPE